MIAAKVKLKNGRWETWLGDSIHYIGRAVAFVGPPHRPDSEVPFVNTLERIRIAQVRHLERFKEAVRALKQGTCGGAYSLGVMEK